MTQRLAFVGDQTPSFALPPTVSAYRNVPSGENLTSMAMDGDEMPHEGDLKFGFRLQA